MLRLIALLVALAFALTIAGAEEIVPKATYDKIKDQIVAKQK